MAKGTRGLIDWLGGGRRARMPDLGPREMAILDLLWKNGAVSAQHVLEKSAADSISLSTIQSTLERLYRKGLVGRSKSGRAYCYKARLSRSQLIGALLKDLADDMTGGDVAPMLSGFMEYVAREAPELEPGVSEALMKTRRERD